MEQSIAPTRQVAARVSALTGRFLELLARSSSAECCGDSGDHGVEAAVNIVVGEA